MDRGEPQGAGGSGRARKRAGRRARGLAIIERDGYWHVQGTVRASGRSIRVRRSLGIPAEAAAYDAAWDEARAIEEDIRAEATGQAGRGDAVAIAAQAYLTFKRKRPLAPSAIRIVKEVVAKFGTRRLNDIKTSEWKRWIEERHAHNKAETRERFLNGVVALLRFAKKHHGLAEIPAFERDKDARNPVRRARRRVSDLRPDLIGLLLQCSHITLRAQLAVEWSTGARVSSVLYGVRVCDVILAPGREQIIFRDTKNGDDVAAALHPTAAEILREYAEWRGRLHEREQPFFLTFKRKPYVDNGRATGGQNKRAFNAAKRRARRALLKRAFDDAWRLRQEGRRDEALALLLAAREDARLLRRVTQHWFRHMLATRMAPMDLRAAMEQGGWKDHRSVLGYVHDVPERRRAIVLGFDSFDTFLTRATAGSPNYPSKS